MDSRNASEDQHAAAITGRTQATFGALIVVQAAHSVEECVGHLWESFPPARFTAGLFGPDLERNFVTLNILLVTFGAWCFFWPVRRHWPSAAAFAWGWTVIELINGVGHSGWTLRQGGYTPGVATAPVLFMLAVYLARQLLAREHDRA